MKYYNKRTDAIMMPETFRWRPHAIHDERHVNIMKYASLVMKVVNKFNREDNRVGVFDKHDLIQSGFVGLIEGYDRIIKSEGKPNVKYLELNIKGTIDRYLNYQATGVAIPEYQLQKQKAEVMADRIFGAWMYSFRLQDYSPGTDILFENIVHRQDSFYNEELNEDLSDLMWQLTERERSILNMSFGVNLPKKSMKEMEEVLDLERTQIYRIKKRALEKLNSTKNRMFFAKYL